MSGKAKPADSKQFNRGGRPGRAPGRGPRNLAGTTPTFSNSRPMPGMALAKFRRHPPKGTKP